MAALYTAVCKDCRNEFEFRSGGLMSCLQKVCDKCGDSINVPYRAPAASFELSKQGLREYVRHGSFDRDGREFTTYERNNLVQLTRSCTCGGEMVFDDGEGSVKHRCPECQSSRLEIVGRGFVD